MNIITLGTEKNLFNKNTRVYKRIFEYSNLCDKYYCFVLTNNKNSEKIIDGNFNVIPVFYKSKILAIYNLYQCIKKEKIINKNDTLISSQDPFELGILSFIFAKYFKYNLHIQIHTDIGSKYFRRESIRHYFQYLISKFILRKAKGIRAVSNRIKNYLIKNMNISEDKITVEPVFSIDLYEWQKNKVFLPLAQRNNIILILGRIEKVKNISLGIEAFILLQRQEKYKDFILKIVGDGTQKKYLQRKYKNVKNIIWENWSNNVEENFGEAKIFLLTSFYEGWGMTIVEAVSCGTPVVMTNVGCANEFIFNNLNGQIIKDFKIKSVVNGIKNILENIENYSLEKLQNSLNILPNKKKHLEILKDNWAKALK